MANLNARLNVQRTLNKCINVMPLVVVLCAMAVCHHLETNGKRAADKLSTLASRSVLHGRCRVFFLHTIALVHTQDVVQIIAVVDN